MLEVTINGIPMTLRLQSGQCMIYVGGEKLPYFMEFRDEKWVLPTWNIPTFLKEIENEISNVIIVNT